jgi:hypothetical protein
VFPSSFASATTKLPSTPAIVKPVASTFRRLLGQRPLDVKEMDERIDRVRDLLVAIDRVGQHEFHIRLPGPDPDLAHQHILNNDGAGGGNGHLSGPAAARGFSHAVHLPFWPASVETVWPAEKPPARPRRRRRYPDPDGHALLEHHVIGDQGGKFDAGLHSPGHYEQTFRGFRHGASKDRRWSRRFYRS